MQRPTNGSRSLAFWYRLKSIAAKSAARSMLFSVDPVLKR